MRSMWKDFRRRKVLLVRNYASGEQLANIGLWQKSQGADSVGKENAKLSQNQRPASACDAAQRCNNPPAVDPGKKLAAAASCTKLRIPRGSRQQRRLAESRHCRHICWLQFKRAACANFQSSFGRGAAEEGKPLPADLSAKHCDAAVQEAVVASANTEPAAATVQQSCEFFGEALAFRLNGWIAKTFTLSVAIIRMIMIFLLIFNMLSQMFNSMLCLCISNPCWSSLSSALFFSTVIAIDPRFEEISLADLISRSTEGDN